MKAQMMATGKYWFCAALFALGLLVGNGKGAAAVTLTAGNVAGAAGTTVSVPITLDAGSAQILNIQFNLTVAAQGGAPAVGTLTYTANTPPGAPALTDSSTPGEFLASYPSDISPPLTGRVTMGTLRVPIPAGATGSYQVRVLNVSALDPHSSNVAISGQPGTVTLDGSARSAATTAPAARTGLFGCHSGRPDGSAAWPLLIPAVGVLAAKRRQRRAGRGSSR